MDELHERRLRFRERLSDPSLTPVAAVWDPFGARFAEAAGFECLQIGGYGLGFHLGITEPLVTLTEFASVTRYIAAVSSLPPIVDGGACYGDPLHVMRTVRELEAAGAAAIHIEDQEYPKRAHYFKGVERVIPRSEMVEKVKAAVEARRDPHTVIIGRTDAMRTDGFDEGVERANLYLDAGAEMVMVFPNSLEELRRAPDAIDGPIYYINSEGNRFGRPVLTNDELGELGYRMTCNSSALVTALAGTARETLKALRERGVSPLPREVLEERRTALERFLGLEAQYEFEARTSPPAAR
jgi:methylisocitrate lyase